MAEILGRSDDLASLAVGREADVSALDMLSGRLRLTDNAGAHLVSETLLQPTFRLRGGRRFAADSAHIPNAEALAA